MNRFPDEFADLLNRRGRALLSSNGTDLRRTFGRTTPFALLTEIISPKKANECTALLERTMLPMLRKLARPIPRESISGMTVNFSERLEKTVRVHTAILNSPRSRSYAVAEEIGLLAMMRSESLRRFAEAITGDTLEELPGCQVICYRPGDYSGPHNDHHPEQDHLRNGYVDVHLTFNNSAVSSQLLVYEEKGYLSNAVEVGRSTGVSIYRLPFWHYTTPLIPKPGREDARRWLLLSSFTLVQEE